jgi:hypothetical protein
MKYHSIEPEVAGGLGANTIMDRTVHPPVVTKLHCKVNLDAHYDDYQVRLLTELKAFAGEV